MSKQFSVAAVALLLIVGTIFFISRAHAEGEKEVQPLVLSQLPAKNSEWVLSNSITLRNITNVVLVSYGGMKMYVVHTRNAEGKESEYLVNPEQLVHIQTGVNP